MGDFHEEYKAAPEAQRLLDWIHGRGMQHIVSHAPGSVPQPHSLHAYLRPAAGGSKVILFDVSFPQHLNQLQHAMQPNPLGQNASTALLDLSLNASQPSGFSPSVAAAADWQAPLASLCHSQCSITALGQRIVVRAPVLYSKVCPRLPCVCCAYRYIRFVRVFGVTGLVPHQCLQLLPAVC